MDRLCQCKGYVFIGVDGLSEVYGTLFRRMRRMDEVVRVYGEGF